MANAPQPQRPDSTHDANRAKAARSLEFANGLLENRAFNEFMDATVGKDLSECERILHDELSTAEQLVKARDQYIVLYRAAKYLVDVKNASIKTLQT